MADAKNVKVTYEAHAGDAQVTDGAFNLDTSNMAAAAKSCQTLSEEMRSVKEKIEDNKNNLMDYWIGLGRNQFEKEFHSMMRQFTDINDEIFDFYKEIVAAEEAYIQTDTNVAKSMDGQTAHMK